MLAMLDALVIWAIPVMITRRSVAAAGTHGRSAPSSSTGRISRRERQALKWLAPGLWLTAMFAVFPILYTFYVSLTNWQTGNYLNKSQAIERIEAHPGHG